MFLGSSNRMHAALSAVHALAYQSKVIRSIEPSVLILKIALFTTPVLPSFCGFVDSVAVVRGPSTSQIMKQRHPEESAIAVTEPFENPGQTVRSSGYQRWIALRFAR
jgi:hypothetical protein